MSAALLQIDVGISSELPSRELPPSMLPLLVSLCALLSKGSAETLWFPVPLLTNYEFSRAGGDPTDGLTTYVATASYTPPAPTPFILPGDEMYLTKGSDVAIARVSKRGQKVDYSCSIGSDNYAQCVRSWTVRTYPPEIHSWTTSVCAATTVPPDRPTPLGTGGIARTNEATASESPWLPCPTSNDPAPTQSFVALLWFLYSLVAFLTLLLEIKLMTWIFWLPARKADLTHWDAPSIDRSLIHLPSPRRSISISPVRDDGSEAGSPEDDTTDAAQPPSRIFSNSMSSSPASHLKTPPTILLGPSQRASSVVPEPPETVMSSAEIDLLAPRTTSVSTFCTQVMSSSTALDMTIEGIETRLTRRIIRNQHFLLLRIRHESRWAYLRIDMMGTLYSPSTLPAFDAPLHKADGPTIRIFDNQSPEASQLLLEKEMSTAMFYATRWTVEYPGLDPMDISQLHKMKSKNPAHHYQLLEIGPGNVSSSKTPTLQDFACVLQSLEKEVAPLARHPVLGSLVPAHAALLWTIIPRTVLLAAHRPQWLIYYHRSSVENLPYLPFFLGVIVSSVAQIPLILYIIYLINGVIFGDPPINSVRLFSVLAFTSPVVLRLLTNVMGIRWQRRWDARAGILLSRILERIESGTLEESTLSRGEAIDLYHPHVTEQQLMHIFRLEPIRTPSTTYNISGLGIGLSESSHIILEPVPVNEFFSEDVLEPRQTTLGQFCTDLRVDTRGSAALIEAVSWRKSQKRPFLHEFVILLVRHGVQYYTVRIDRRGKLNKALDGLLLSGNAMEVVTIDHWKQRNYRTLDLFNEHEKSDPVVTLVSWHFDLPWLTNPGDPELAALAMQQSGTAIRELFQLGNATQLTASRRPTLGDLVVLWETMGREAPRYCLPSYNCYWQSRTMTFLIARRFPREFILRERSLPVTSIRQLHTRSFVVADFFKHWSPWYFVVGRLFSNAVFPAVVFNITVPLGHVSIASGVGDQFYGFQYPGHSSFKDMRNQWNQDLGRLLSATTAFIILALGPIFFMGWNMNRATKRMWNHVRQIDEEIDGVDDTPGLGHSDPISKRKPNKTLMVVLVTFSVIFVGWRTRFIIVRATGQIKRLIGGT